jgi:hypothetical protein
VSAARARHSPRIVGTVEGLIVYGDTLGVGTAAQELTPRLLISVDPKGIPVRALPLGVVGDVEVGGRCSKAA